MKRSTWVNPVLALLAAAGLGGKHLSAASKAAVVTTAPTASHIPPIRCGTTAELLAALAIARKTPNIVIELQPIEYALRTSLIVQGDGTTIHGNGATIVSQANYTGVTDPLTNQSATGAAIVVEPLLGPAVKNLKQKNGLWFNPRGTVGILDKAAGGAPQDFNELAPCQDGVLPALSAYSLYAPYLVPARNITITDLNVRFASVLCDAVISVTYAQNVMISNLTELNVPSDLGHGGGPGDFWSNGSQYVTFDNCHGPMYIEMNSSTSCNVTNCVVGGVTFEEMCRLCTVSNSDLMTCRTNDIMCSDITFDSNSFAGTGDNVAALWGGTRLTFKNNVCEGALWLGLETRNCVISGNRGTLFSNFAAKSSGNTLSTNALTER